jgi:SpoVK/Ycf46/Vps4 family AAA+-type ATPase
LKQFLSRILAGDRAPKTVVIIDEIEKALGGAGTDTSGVSTDQLAVLLTAMQDKKAAGILLMGPPGAGKTVVAKAAANEASALGIMFDLGGMKSSLVGSSEQRIRSALRVIDAVSSGLPLFIATCNSVAALPPELLRRFNLARFFVDLPTPDERKSIWGIHRKKYEIDPKDPGPASDSQWTGAEIENACDIARRLNQPLAEAAKYIVPIAKSAEATITRLRQQAGGHFISASEPGPYLYVDPKLTEAPAGGRRQLSYELEDSK